MKKKLDKVLRFVSAGHHSSLAGSEEGRYRAGPHSLRRLTVHPKFLTELVHQNHFKFCFNGLLERVH